MIRAGGVEILIAAPRSELGMAISRIRPRARASGDARHVVLNVGLQPPNTLLHDGHAWQRYPPSRLVTDTRAVLRDAAGADFVVHASYLFLGAVQPDRGIEPPLGDIVEAALEAEDLVLRGSIQGCVVRLGYRYGPESRDLRSYRTAFRLGRPYWAGSSRIKQRHLHSADAAAALLAAARQRPAGRILTAADDLPASFASFMDHFARLIGNRIPLHIPGLMRPLTRVLIAEEHVQQVDLESAAAVDRPRPRGFAPLYSGYRSGLAAVLETWQT
jgi:nucleoside-diphosphate-sugar epimerase